MREAFERTEHCPEVEKLALLEEGRLEQAEAARLRTHVEGCTACEAELALYRGFLAAESRVEERPDVEYISARLSNPAAAERESESWWQRWLKLPAVPRWAFSVAALLLVAAVSLQVWRRQSGIGEVEWSGVARSGQLTLEAPLGELDQAPRRFSWRPAPGASIYQIRVLEVDGAQLWTGDSRETQFPAPAELLKQLGPRRAFIWEVVGLDGNGKEVARSGRARFRWDSSEEGTSR